ncbi:MAG: hypothetical protein L0Y61_00685 [Epsilonproteobacteria bacterium]|nr:hypothetical protein [Campylobacterota bacterium]
MKEKIEIDLLIPDEESLISNRNQIEKELILEEIMAEMEKNNMLPTTTLIGSILILFVVVFVLGLKIHFSNRIYELSRDIANLKSERSYLAEQNAILQMKLEQQKYKSNILDSIF